MPADPKTTNELSDVCNARLPSGGSCNKAAVRRGRCAQHAAYSTGPRTEAGKARSAANSLKHGYRTREVQDFRRLLRLYRRASDEYWKALGIRERLF